MFDSKPINNQTLTYVKHIRIALAENPTVRVISSANCAARFSATLSQPQPEEDLM